MRLEPSASATGYLVPSQKLESVWRECLNAHFQETGCSDKELRDLARCAIKEASAIDLSDDETENFFSGVSMRKILDRRTSVFGDIKQQWSRPPAPPDARVYPETPNESSFLDGIGQIDPKAGCTVVALVILGLMTLIGALSGDSHRTDGVFESGLKKIDHGRPELLTKEEIQRIDDVMNWCDRCKKPLRQCPHGP